MATFFISSTLQALRVTQCESNPKKTKKKKRVSQSTLRLSEGASALQNPCYTLHLHSAGGGDANNDASAMAAMRLPGMPARGSSVRLLCGNESGGETSDRGAGIWNRKGASGLRTAMCPIQNLPSESQAAKKRRRCSCLCTTPTNPKQRVGHSNSVLCHLPC